MPRSWLSEKYMMTSDLHQHHHVSEALHEPGTPGGSVCTDNFEQRRRHGRKVAQRVSAGKGSTNDDERRRRGTKPFAEHVELCRPSGAQHVFSVYPGLTPWATFLTRLTALWLLAQSDLDRQLSQEFSERGRLSR